VRPFPSFTITPSEGSIDTYFTFDATGSSDIEDDVSLLEVRWDFDNDGVWDTGFTKSKIITYNYTSSGIKTIRLEVKDVLGSTRSIAKQLYVAPSNLPPYASFTVTPENQHDNSSIFNVSLDATGSYDGEDPVSGLNIQWDFEDDGIWDTDWSNDLVITHTYTLPGNLYSKSVSLPDFAKKIFILGNYAYIAAGNAGLQIVNISDPEDPILVKNYDTHGEAQSVYISGNRAYIAVSSVGLEIIDILNPLNPSLLGTYPNTSYNYDVCVSGDYAYIADFLLGLKVINIANPIAPALAGSIGRLGLTNNVFVNGNYAFVAASNFGLQIVSIVNPGQPALIKTFDTPGDARDVFISGDYAYVADGNAGLQIINIADPASPVLVKSYAMPGYAHGIYVSGQYVYIAAGSSGLTIIDISDPANPRTAVSADTLGDAQDVFISGDYAYVADGGSGLTIFDIKYPFRYEARPISKHWKIRLEVIDENGNMSSSTRDIWKVTYNHQPYMDNIEIFKEGGSLKARVVNGNDLDINTTWDGLLEYRWDFDNDGIWDTKFSTLNDSVFVPSDCAGNTIACEVRDRFGATARATAVVPIPNQPPVIGLISDKIINEGESIDFTVVVTDEDGDDLTLSCTHQIINAGFDITNKYSGYIEGHFMWTPTHNDVGDHIVTFTAEDGKGGSASSNVTITVEAPLFFGIVRNSLDEKRLSGVTIRLKDSLTGTILSSFKRTTDPEGIFKVYARDKIPNGSYIILADKTGYTEQAYYTKKAYPIPGQPTTIWMNEVINNPASISGYIKTVFGSPIPYRAQVDLVHKERGIKYRTFTDQVGFYRFTNLPTTSPAIYNITISRINYIAVSEDITVQPNESRIASYNLVSRKR